MDKPTANYDMLLAAGVIPQGKTLSSEDIYTINNVLTPDEVNALIEIKQTLGDDFVRRNVGSIL